MDREKTLVLPEPDSIKRSAFHTIEYGDIESEEDLELLIHILWRYPESTVYYYLPKDDPKDGRDQILWAAHERGDMLMNEMERNFYAHPENKHDYIKIVPRNGRYAWEWEKVVAEKGPEYRRITLTLGGSKKTQLEIWDKIRLEEEYRVQRDALRYAYDVFLSYATADTTEAELVYKLLIAAGKKVFMAPKILEPGDDFAEEIRSALVGSKELWLLVSPSSAKSEWVTSEWGAAWVLKKKIIPILHRCTPDLLPERLRKLHCIDLYKCVEYIEKTFTSAKG